MMKPPLSAEADAAGQQTTRTAPWLMIMAASLGAFSVGLIWLVTALAQNSEATPIREGYAVGSMSIREKDYITELKCNGCKVECFDHFLVVHIDSTKEPTWTDDYIKIIPWERVEHMTLLPHESAE